MARLPRSLDNLPLDAIKPDTPIRLELAARLAFPGGGITAASLRTEARKGRLVVETIAAKDFTTLAAIEEMRLLCRVSARERAPRREAGDAEAALALARASVRRLGERKS